MTRPWFAAVSSAAIYAALTAFLGRDVLSGLGTTIASDEGDPLLVASILHWNAVNVPLSDRWWQFPVFAPTRDTLTFSEHFLGLIPLSTPLHWFTHDPVATYNLVTLLTFPLCGLAMFALAYRLTRHTTAAFLAGLAFAFAPYRFSQLPHLQVLAFFWGPLALLGLHGYLETGRRRWLVLYGAAWMLQGATNGYALVFLSVLIGFWVIWFIVSRRRWKALIAIAVATVVSALPFVPILARYASAHALHGFTREPGAIRAFGADLAAVLCAPSKLTVWGWLRVACQGEGELFPGLVVAVSAVVALFQLADRRPDNTRLSRLLTISSRVFLVVGFVYLVLTCAVILGGPWRLEVGLLRVSVSSVTKLVMLTTFTLLPGLILSPMIRGAAQGSSVPGFYLTSALLTWLLALGPTIRFMGTARGFQAPFALLMYLPGVQSLRVPARFWLLTTMCLAVLVAFVAASLLERRRSSIALGGAALMGILILADGWVARIPAVPVPPAVPDARLLQNATVLTVPMDSLPDIAGGFRAVIGGWRSVNGYSGYFPSYYAVLQDAANRGEEGALVPFLRDADLQVILSGEDLHLKGLLERLPGVSVTATRAGAIQYRIGGRQALPSVEDIGVRLPVQTVRASCEAPNAVRTLDGDERTGWACGPQRPGHELVVDLGRPAAVGAVVQSLAQHPMNYPRSLLLETSVDGESWSVAWDGSIRGLLIAQAIDRPGPATRVTVPFAPRTARYVRVRQTGYDERFKWSVAEIEIWTGKETTGRP